MKLHPKMAIPKKLEEGFMDLALDIGYTKVRWQLRKDEEKAEDIGKDSKKDKEKEELIEMEEAKTRTVYDSENRIYDERKQKVTDLKECSRIYFPKPLEVVKEAQLEMRRELHSKISEEYRKEKCDDKGRQEKNLTAEEDRGLRKLEKRKLEDEIVVINTDID